MRGFLHHQKHIGHPIFSFDRFFAILIVVLIDSVASNFQIEGFLELVHYMRSNDHRLDLGEFFLTNHDRAGAQQLYSHHTWMVMISKWAFKVRLM